MEVIAVDQRALTETVKIWLRRYGDLDREIRGLISRCEALRARLEAPASGRLDGMPRSPGFAGDRLGADLARLEALEAECRRKSTKAAALYSEIDSAIDQINGPRRADIQLTMRARYLDIAPWTFVCELLYGDRDDFADRQESLLRRVHRLHSEALVALAEIVDLSGDTGKASKNQ